MITASPPYRVLQRRLILRDSLIFVVLTLIVVALFGVTLFLFRSFTTHQQELAQRWYQRGKQDLEAHRPIDAVNDLRTALGYGPANKDYAFTLAEALDQAGKLDESFAYFSNLLEAEPGSGPLNLQLARLSAKKGVIADALRYYRASIYGNWENDALKSRRAVRLELIKSMLDYGQHDAARTELLIASEDAGDDPASLPRIASLMNEASEYALALPLFQKALAADPKNEDLLEGAGLAAFSLGHYASAEKYLQQASDQRVEAHHGELPSVPRNELEWSQKIVALFPAPDLPAVERVAGIQRIAAMMPSLLSNCRAQVVARGGNTTALAALDQAWSDSAKKWATTVLRRDPAAQNAELQLIYKTGNQTRQICPASSGDDMLVQLMTKSPDTILQ
jgi:tetratricopeptide (TPR) repeat protein